MPDSTASFFRGLLCAGLCGLSLPAAAQQADPAPGGAALAPSLAPSVAAPDGGDAAAGGMAFLQCSDCHSAGSADGIGPGLRGIFGRRAGSHADFRYSPAMAKSTLVWDASTLAKFLADPKGVVPGTSMDFPGVQDAAERANLVAYLATLR
ncbi:MAG TPA: c-type cytochrome [Burkholderiaceae bacterium]|jgi:cytochrome c|nr:c-type cytochrome [Burkholderiaceae bacterium]